MPAATRFWIDMYRMSICRVCGPDPNRPEYLFAVVASLIRWIGTFCLDPISVNMFLTAQHPWRALDSAKIPASPDDVATADWVFDDDPLMKPCIEMTIPDVERRSGDNLLPA